MAMTINYQAYRNNAFIGKATAAGAETETVFTIFPNATAAFPGKALAYSANAYAIATGAPLAVSNVVYDADAGTITITHAAAAAGDLVMLNATVVE